jgi:hypothetical protein
MKRSNLLTERPAFGEVSLLVDAVVVGAAEHEVIAQ